MIYKKIFAAIAGLITLIAIFVNIFLYQKMRELSNKLALNEVTKEESVSQPVPHPVEQSSDKAVKNSNTDEMSELEYQLNATEEEIDMMSDQLTGVLDETNMGATPEEVEKRLIENEIRQAIDREFSQLYKRLALSPEELDEFKRIELEFRLASRTTEPYMPDNMKKLMKLRKEMKEEYNPDFIDLLGEDKFRIYDEFRNSMQERNEVNNFIADMGPENKISDDVAEKLIHGMYEARRTVEKENGIDDIENSSDSFNVINLRMLDALTQIFKKYEEPADEILPPDQAELFNSRMRNIQKEYAKGARSASLAMEAEKSD